MNGNEMLELLSGQYQIQKVIEMNQITERFGLALTQEDAKMLVEGRKISLREQHRVEFGEGIMAKLILTFCDSQYIYQENYAETMGRLQEIFYLYKNEMLDEISDDELINFMKEQYEEICFGDLEYLESTCLSNFAQAIRAGYGGYKASDGYGQYHKFDEVVRWDYGLYLEALRELCWS